MEISESSPPYQLAASLAGHEQDVRTVDGLDDGTVISGSRDATVRLWRRAEEGGGYTCTSTLTAHTHYVQRVCATAGGLASCSNDKHIIEWDVSAGVPSRILEGHTDVVSCVATSVASGLLYSASWDKTARVWKDGTCVRELKGHEAALWCAATAARGGRRRHILHPHSDAHAHADPGACCRLRRWPTTS